MSLARADLKEDLHSRVFGLHDRRYTNRRIGLEIECIPVRPGSRAVDLPDDPDGGTRELFDDLARVGGWSRLEASEGGGRWHLPDMGVVSFEPGGQIEYSSTVHDGLPTLRAELDLAFDALRAGASARGIELLFVGIDPTNPVDRAELVLRSERYLRMAEHLDRFGAAGRRMMRQTAAIHLNLEFGPDPLDRWRAANRMAPWLIGIFANSAVYEGRQTGHRSFRAAQWRELDPTRSGVVRGDDPVEGYLELALEAPVLFLGDSLENRRSLGEWLDGGAVDLSVWRRHLTTLFPEVRPRGWMELRGVDTLPLEEALVPAVLACGALYDDRARREVVQLLPEATEEGLRGAGRDGLTDPAFRERAQVLWEIALDGAARIVGFVGEQELQAARSFRDRLTAQGLDPASRAAESDARAG